MKKAILQKIIIWALILLIVPVIPVFADSMDTFCQQAPNGKDQCIKDIAVERNDVDICRRIEADSVRGSCYESFANTMDDIELCKRVPKGARGFDTRYKCYMRFVKTKDDLYICNDLIKTDRARDDCYDEILDNNKEDIGVCSLFASQKKRVSCYSKVARKVKEEAHCELILAEKNQGRESQCKYCETKGVDFDDYYSSCKKYFFMKDMESMCRDYEKEFDAKLVLSEKQKLNFNGENPTRDRFWISFKQATHDGPIQTHEAVLSYSDGVRHEEYVLRIGQHVAGENDVAIQLIDLYEQEEGEDTVSYASICVFRPSSKEGQEPEPEEEEKPRAEEKEEELDKEKEKLVKEVLEKQKKAEEEKKEENKEKIENNTKDNKKDKKEDKKERVKIKEGGFFYKLAMFFKKLFG